MELLYKTRFSYFGMSGWKSEASKSPEMLFAAHRMLRRFELFEKITLPSLLHQTDPEFKLVLLTSASMPEEYAILLREMTHDLLGERRVKILCRARRYAGRVFRGDTQTSYAPDHLVCQVVLDDDDAVSRDFTEICRQEARRALETDYDNDPSRFISFSRGANLLVKDGTLKHLSNKFTPMVNLGLALASRADTDKHPYLTQHLAIGENHPSVVINTQRPFYLRTVHDHNDSRTPHKKNWMTQEEIAEMATHFPLLRDHFPIELGAAA